MSERRVPVGNRAYFLGSTTSLDQGEDQESNNTVVIDSNGFHEIKEIDSPPPAAVTSTESKAGSVSLKTSKKTALDVNDESLFARLEELERQEAQEATKAKETAAAATASRRNNNSAEITALKKRMAEIKAVDDYDENPLLMKELKNFSIQLFSMIKDSI